ncbi:hypothetical protein [Actinoplanes couchii]|uniref:Uncharacterized protein n=1 Tax=Actinoplanes couchii TaxID=403638 RepID=A0ABQ3X1X7_9ACTN|nr:hypothetical protein [Actinoplanes couchii]MDR6316921.1 hypothetical protein [Actinoplanes couchii]GID52528.1 hypothetical protein Aco03nite_009320 [Actinoplanes couchii]
MRTESDLIHLLSDEPPTPSAVDVRRAIAAGRRRKTTRRVYTVTGAVVAVAAVVAGGALFTPKPGPDEVAVASAACTVRMLAMPDGVRSAVVLGSDRTGRFLAGRTDPAGDDPVLWQDGIPRLLDFPGTGSSSLTGVNSSGTAVGKGVVDGRSRPYVYRQGVFTALPGASTGSALPGASTGSALPGASTGSATAINDAGVIAGSSGDAAVRWPSASEEPVHLPVPDGTGSSIATGVGADGTVIGSADRRAFAWRPDGTRLELPPVTIDGVAATTAMPVRISGDRVFGTVATGTPSNVAATASFRWNLSTGTVEVGDETLAGGISWVRDDTTAGNDPPVLVSGTGTRSLPLPDGTMKYAAELYTVSDDARTVSGHVVDPAGAVRPVVWTCD